LPISIGRCLRWQRWSQRRQTVGGSSGVTVGIVLTVDPGRFEFTASTRALFIKGTAHPAAHIAQQPDAARRLALSALHRNVERADLHGYPVGNRTTRRDTFAPKERHSKIRAAGTAGEARIVGRHE